MHEQPNGKCAICGGRIFTLPGRRPPPLHARCVDELGDDADMIVAGVAAVGVLAAMLKHPEMADELAGELAAGFTRDIRAAAQLDDVPPGERL